ncbi:MAG: response regulator transcription factor [Bacteroidales bacterium]|nr:response regulator transcription factor [Bacteroidales bacterium]
MPQSNIEILIVEDHDIFREGIKFVLSQVTGYKVVGEVKNGKEFLEFIKKKRPDIVLMDITMPEMDGIQASTIAMKEYPNLKIICLSSHGDEIYYYKMIKAGVSGFLQKKSGKDELEQAIDNVAYGMNYFPDNILRNILFRVSNTGEESLKNEAINLTKREKEILLLICQGYSNNEIGETLFISPKTVDNHRTNLLSKTGTRNSANLVMYAIKNKLIEI